MLQLFVRRLVRLGELKLDLERKFGEKISSRDLKPRLFST